MKKIYLKPELEVMLIEAESILAGTGEQSEGFKPDQPTDPVPIVPGPWG